MTEDRLEPGTRAADNAELREARKRIRLLGQAYLANALFDAHRGDPEFGYPVPRRRSEGCRAGPDTV